MWTTEQAAGAKMRIPVVGHLPGAGFLNDRLSDGLVLLAALPEIASHLRIVSEHTVHMDQEVTRMRAGVERLEHEVQELRAEIVELRAEITQVGASVDRLEPHVADLSRLARPLKRLRHRGSSDLAAVTPLAPVRDDESLSAARVAS